MDKFRIEKHPILGDREPGTRVRIFVDGEPVEAEEGDTIAGALWASGRVVLRHSPKYEQPRGIYCANGRCTDCVMQVDGIPNIRTCITPVRAGMQVVTQKGVGSLEERP
ncbi:MAG: (2Fe-2S)-binding protein [Deltaproteobacteria bacterium]|nr:(2Fe-2S)-binding protein [Deltaproteobacteria bacterium]MBW2305396.1 (2Fe-2S)-binding protein [Deltaproteobacteria bacterium]